MIDRRSPDPRRHPPDRRTEDRRMDDRLLSEAGIRFLRADKPGSILRGELLDVSPAGARILLEVSLAPAESLLVEVPDLEGRWFSMTARVVWTEAADPGNFFAGCEFPVELTPRQYATLRKLARGADA